MEKVALSDAARSSTENPLSLSNHWYQLLQEHLPLFGHRNWIVVADSAYPAQSRLAVQTISSAADHLQVLGKVLAALRSCAHVKPIIHADRELQFVSEHDAPGITDYRDELAKLLAEFEPSYTGHEEIISMLDRAAQMFQVLIIKTNMTIPYTSVFFELDCAYWNKAAEERLRSGMRSERKPRTTARPRTKAK